VPEAQGQEGEGQAKEAQQAQGPQAAVKVPAVLTESDRRTLARRQVADVQRARMLAAMVDVAAERGVADTAIAHVVARSGVSRRTFYDIFTDREDCFLAAFDDAVERAAETIGPVCMAAHGWRDRMREGLTALLGFCERNPKLAHLLFVSSLNAGPVALARRTAVLERLQLLVDEGRQESRRKAGAPASLTAEGIVGAVAGVMHARLATHRSPRLLELANPLMSMIVLPYLGRAAADRELTRTVRSVPSPKPRQESNALQRVEMRLTYRTIRVLLEVADNPDASNRHIANSAGIVDQGQISKLLARLQGLGLVKKAGASAIKGAPNAWRLTARGHELSKAIKQQAAEASAQVTVSHRNGY
jgi:AcrR family transcriptional regulator/DNA-binding MarR family transcriptional regulator